MENPEEVQQTQQEITCAKCGSPDVEPGYKTNLCAPCRTELSHFPVLNWIKISAFTVFALLVMGLFSLPRYLGASIHFERGSKDEEDKKFMSAQHEFEEVVKDFPEWTDANAHLFLAAYNNGNMEKVLSIFSTIGGRETDDVPLSNEVNDVIAELDNYFVTDTSILTKLNSLPPDSPQKFVDTLYSYVRSNSTDLFAKYMLANKLFDLERYEESAVLLDSVTYHDPQHIGAWSLLGATNRELKRFDEAINCFNQLLYYNSESTLGIAGKAKVEFKRFNDKEGMKLALEADKIEPNDYSNTGIIALGYFLMNNTEEFKKAYEKFKSLNPDSASVTRLDDIVSGRKPYR